MHTGKQKRLEEAQKEVEVDTQQAGNQSRADDVACFCLPRFARWRLSFRRNGRSDGFAFCQFWSTRDIALRHCANRSFSINSKCKMSAEHRATCGNRGRGSSSDSSEFLHSLILICL